MTSRRLSRRPVLPVLVALSIGATTAGTATVLATPLGRPTSDDSVLTVSLPGGDRPAATARPPSPRPTTNTAPTTTPPSTTTVAPSTTGPAEPPGPSGKKTKPAPTSTSPAPPPGSDVDQVVALVNDARTSSGCTAVRVDPKLTTAASGHSTDMSEREYFSHTTPEGVTFDQRITDAGYPSPGAENIARGQRSATSVMDAWMKSPGHRANILNCQLTAIGVGLDTTGYYWTQDFGY